MGQTRDGRRVRVLPGCRHQGHQRQQEAKASSVARNVYITKLQQIFWATFAPHATRPSSAPLSKRVCIEYSKQETTGTCRGLRALRGFRPILTCSLYLPGVLVVTPGRMLSCAAPGNSSNTGATPCDVLGEICFCAQKCCSFSVSMFPVFLNFVFLEDERRTDSHCTC